MLRLSFHQDEERTNSKKGLQATNSNAKERATDDPFDDCLFLLQLTCAGLQNNHTIIIDNKLRLEIE